MWNPVPLLSLAIVIFIFTWAEVCSQSQLNTFLSGNVQTFGIYFHHMNFSQSTKERSAVKHLLKVINPLILHNLSYYLDVEQFLVASNSATEASVFKLVLPDCDIHDTGNPMCSVIRLSLSAENLIFFSSQPEYSMHVSTS